MNINKNNGGIHMLKKSISIFVVLSMLISILSISALAQEQKKLPGILEITLEEAIKFAFENNTNIKDLKDKCKDMDDEYDKLSWKVNNIKSIPNKVNFSSENEYALYKGYPLEQLKFKYDELLKLKELTEKITNYNIESLSYGIQETTKELEYLKKVKQKLEKDLAIAKLKLQLEIINQNQLDQAKIAVTQMDTNMKKAYDGLKTQKNALKALVGVDRTVTLNIELPEKEFKEIGDINLDEIKDKAMTDRGDAILVTNNLNSKKMNYELKDYYKAYIAYDEYKDTLDEYNKAKDRYENDLNDIKEKVGNAYETVITLDGEYKDALETYKNTLELHKMNKLRYSLGMISLIDFMGSEIVLDKANNDLKKSLDKNILAKKMFEISYTLGDSDTIGLLKAAQVPTAQ